MKDPERADRSRYRIEEDDWCARIFFVTPRSTTDYLRVIADVESREMAERLVDAEVAYHSTPDPFDPLALEDRFAKGQITRSQLARDYHDAYGETRDARWLKQAVYHLGVVAGEHEPDDEIEERLRPKPLTPLEQQ